MYSTRDRLNKRTPKNGLDRRNYLKLLTDEFANATTHEAKYQVLANLSNFSYDPINFAYILELGIVQLFLSQLEEKSDALLVHYASAGLCNLAVYPVFANYLIENGGLNLLASILEWDNAETALNAITSLLYLCSDRTRELLKRTDIIACMLKYGQSTDTRFKNLSLIYLDEVLMLNLKHRLKMLSNRFPFIMVNNKSYQKICKIHTTSFASTPFKVGDKIRIQKTLTQKDLDAFSNLTSDHNPIHSPSGRGRTIVHGALLNGLVAGLIGTHMPGPGTVLVSQTMKFPNKCFVGERLTINVELVDTRKILRVKFYCEVEDEKKVVFEGEAKLVMAKDN